MDRILRGGAERSAGERKQENWGGYECEKKGGVNDYGNVLDA